MKITSKKIKELLKTRHSGDIFVPECKMGPFGSRIMDGWAMKKSWSNQVYTGYEIKVSRSDFMQDEKYHQYLECCNRFYWVCPSGLIDKSEVGENCGLIYVSKTGNKLFTKKKAPALIHNDISVKKLMSYILMYRISGVCSSTFGDSVSSDSNAEYWEKWLENKEHKSLIGRSVSRELRQRVYEEIDKTKIENDRLIAHNYRLEEIKRFLSEIGIDPSGYVRTWTVKSALDGKQNEIVKALKKVTDESEKLLQLLQEES